MERPPGDDPEPSEPPSLEERKRTAGRLPGDRYVRIVRPSEFRRAPGGIYVATESATAPRTRLGRVYDRIRHALFGGPIVTEAEAEERLSKKTGLAILASDNISSSAYATEEAMRVLALAGVAALSLTLPIALAVVAVIAIVVLSESRVIRAYPQGGGSYAVAKENIGIQAGVVAAAALLIDYVLTVAVSTAAGVAAISSFVPQVHDDRAVWAVALIGLLAIGNLRGVREAGVIFAAPTYIYVVALLGLIAYGFYRVVTGDVVTAATPPHPLDQGTQALTAILILRAFASGAVGLTGSEAVANGTPSFRPPESRNAVIALVWMGVLFSVIFLGLTYLATTVGVVPDAEETETVNSLITRSLVGTGPYYYLVQVSTAVLLLLAANTGFTGFPRLASVLANDRFMPRQFAYRGERLAFSFGIVALAVTAVAVVIAFGGSVHALIPLYTIGVFLAFTLSQTGLVRRWLRLRGAGWRASVVVNTVGAVVTGTALLVVAVTKFQAGAWIVLIVLPFLVLLLHGIHRHYSAVADALVLDDLRRPSPVPLPPLVIVPVARLDRSSVRAIGFARSISQTVVAVHIATSSESAVAFERRWEQWDSNVKLDVIHSPYRSLVQPLLRYIDRIASRKDRPVAVVLAEFVPHRWWEWILHSQTAARLKLALLFRPNTIVIDVPYHFAQPDPDEDRA